MEKKATIRTAQKQSVNIPKVEKIAGEYACRFNGSGRSGGSDFAARAYKQAQNGGWGGAAGRDSGQFWKDYLKLDFT